MNDGLDVSDKEYLALKDMYRSEGYAIMSRMLDSLIGVRFGTMISSLNDSEVVRLKNEIIGIKDSKELVFSILKEGEAKYENKRT